MLHEILLSLSGHRSPLLAVDSPASPTTAAESPRPANLANSLSDTLSPPERALLADLARLSDLNIRLRAHAARIAAAHPSVVCRAVGAAVESEHLAAFQQAVLAAESTVLRRDAALVGAYDIVPLTAVVAAFADWRRRISWLWELMQFIWQRQEEAAAEENGETEQPRRLVHGAKLIDRLRSELLTGYEDIEATARSLVRVAELAWLRQVSAWILYGRLPSFGGSDFFVQRHGAEQQKRDELSTAESLASYVCVPELLPSFVSLATAASMLSMGRSLVHMRVAGHQDPLGFGDGALGMGFTSSVGGMAGMSGMNSTSYLSRQLQELDKLTYPLESTSFARTMARVRAILSRTVLRRLLPTAKVVDMLQLLRDFFLLGRGEFAMALVEQADVTMRSRWQQVGHLVDGSTTSAGRTVKSTKSSARSTAKSAMRGMHAVLVKDGEVAAVLARTWATLGSMHAGGRHANVDTAEEDEDEVLDLARETLRLVLVKRDQQQQQQQQQQKEGEREMDSISTASTPFWNLLFSVPVSLTLQVPYPLDLVLGPADLQAYTAVHAYLVSIRRAHIRLTGLWKLTSLRRHYPPPPGPPYGSSSTGRQRRAGASFAQVQMLRERYTTRADALRSMWATSSAAIFFLSETESYLQAEVVVALWEGFQQWLTTGQDEARGGKRAVDRKEEGDADADADEDEDEDRGRGENRDEGPDSGLHDPQTLAAAHRQYLRRLVRGLLLDRSGWTEALYGLLVAMDQLVALVQRLHGLWAALDLEADAGVVDAFVDLEREQDDVLDALDAAEREVWQGVRRAVEALREEEDGRGEEEEAKDEEEEEEDEEEDEGGEDEREEWETEGERADSGADGVVRGDRGDRDDRDDKEDKESARGGARTMEESGPEAAGVYVPRRIGGLDRLLTKLDFGFAEGR